MTVLLFDADVRSRLTPELAAAYGAPFHLTGADPSGAIWLGVWLAAIVAGGRRAPLRIRCLPGALDGTSRDTSYVVDIRGNGRRFAISLIGR